MADLTPDEEADIRDSVGRGLTCTADTAAVLAALDAVRAREARLVAAAGMTEDDTERLIEAADRALSAAVQTRTTGAVPEYIALAAHTRALRADLARVTEERDEAREDLEAARVVLRAERDRCQAWLTKEAAAFKAADCKSVGVMTPWCEVHGPDARRYREERDAAVAALRAQEAVAPLLVDNAALRTRAENAERALLQAALVPGAEGHALTVRLVQAEAERDHDREVFSAEALRLTAERDAVRVEVAALKAAHQAAEEHARGLLADLTAEVSTLQADRDALAVSLATLRRRAVGG